MSNTCNFSNSKRNRSILDEKLDILFVYYVSSDTTYLNSTRSSLKPFHLPRQTPTRTLYIFTYIHVVLTLSNLIQIGLIGDIIVSPEHNDNILKVHNIIACNQRIRSQYVTAHSHNTATSHNRSNHQDVHHKAKRDTKETRLTLVHSIHSTRSGLAVQSGIFRIPPNSSPTKETKVKKQM